MTNWNSRTPWGKQRVADKECNAYLSVFLDARFEFTNKLQEMLYKAKGLGGLDGIEEYYMFFKYIVRGGWDKPELFADWLSEWRSWSKLRPDAQSRKDPGLPIDIYKKDTTTDTRDFKKIEGAIAKSVTGEGSSLVDAKSATVEQIEKERAIVPKAVDAEIILVPQVNPLPAPNTPPPAPVTDQSDKILNDIDEVHQIVSRIENEVVSIDAIEKKIDAISGVVKTEHTSTKSLIVQETSKIAAQTANLVDAKLKGWLSPRMDALQNSVVGVVSQLATQALILKSINEKSDVTNEGLKNVSKSVNDLQSKANTIIDKQDKSLEKTLLAISDLSTSQKQGFLEQTLQSQRILQEVLVNKANIKGIANELIVINRATAHTNRTMLSVGENLKKLLASGNLNQGQEHSANALLAAQSRLEELQRKYDMLQGTSQLTSHNAVSTIQRLEGEISAIKQSATQRIQELDNQISLLQGQLASQGGDVNSLRNQITQLEGERQLIEEQGRQLQGQLSDELAKVNQEKDDILRAHQDSLNESDRLKKLIAEGEAHYNRALQEMKNHIISLTNENGRVNVLLQNASQENAKFQNEVKKLGEKINIQNTDAQAYGSTLVELLGVIHQATLEGADIATIAKSTPGVNAEKIINLYNAMESFSGYNFSQTIDEIYSGFDFDKHESFHVKLEGIGTTIRDRLENAGFGPGQIGAFEKTWLAIQEGYNNQVDYGKRALTHMKATLGKQILFGETEPRETRALIEAFQNWSELGAMHELLLGAQVNTIGFLNTYLANMGVPDLITYDYIKDTLHNPVESANDSLAGGRKTSDFINSPQNWTAGLENSVLNENASQLELKRKYQINMPTGDFVEWLKNLRHNGGEITKGVEGLEQRILNVPKFTAHYSKKNKAPTNTASTAPLTSTDMAVDGDEE